MNPARQALTRAVNRAIADGAPVYVNVPVTAPEPMAPEVSAPEPQTDAIFRWEGSRRDGAPVAIFPAIPGTNAYNVTVYAHLGQHGHGTPQYLNRLRLATEAEYAPLLAELKSIGYNPRVVKRMTARHRAARAAECSRVRGGVR